jgi:hypothetical protein
VTTADDTTPPGEQLFWDVAAPLLARADVTRSTMMGFPCLRVGGEYFASTHHATGELIVKLPEPRVDELIAAGRAQPFAPGGRRFREWAAVGDLDEAVWTALLDEALEFVATSPPKKRRTRTKTAASGGQGR